MQFFSDFYEKKEFVKTIHYFTEIGNIYLLICSYICDIFTSIYHVEFLTLSILFFWWYQHLLLLHAHFLYPYRLPGLGSKSSPNFLKFREENGDLDNLIQILMDVKFFYYWTAYMLTALLQIRFKLTLNIGSGRKRKSQLWQRILFCVIKGVKRG